MPILPETDCGVLIQNIGFKDFAVRDFHLTETSSCVDYVPPKYKLILDDCDGNDANCLEKEGG